ncbi:MAG: Glu-tRNA(Gln) amidotransferase subunit GatE [Candidatus Bipolaricaulota bacterium]|nr:Glu-tRNA(Gln) amidotransferase subunit GatE [Candidatus Bipolaricaulota bacterium]
MKKADANSGNLDSHNPLGYVTRRDATADTYRGLGFRCGLEVHQQLRTKKKLFCRCPAGIYQDGADYDAQLVRHMRPTLSEFGEYDGTALMEYKTKKNIIYRIKGETACTYDIDDTPPFAVNREALGIAIEVALLLETSLVGELHITRKQYLDGSIPTGFQRTAIIGIDGRIPVAGKRVGVRQLSVEEDSCREVSDVGHERIYTTDRLGMPLIETVTEPELLTPDEAAEGANYIRYLTRSTGHVNVGIGAAREDVNVSIEGGTRVEIKGVQHIRWIPELTHNEAFRQKALLLVRDELERREGDPKTWAPKHAPLSGADLAAVAPTAAGESSAAVICLPGFSGLLAFPTNPGCSFADEFSDRLKVIACIEKPNMAHSDDGTSPLPRATWQKLGKRVGATEKDAVLLVWGPAADLPTAIETVIERGRLAFAGVPNETRKGLPNGTTIFERVLPGPDRMYPDTDSSPIPIEEDAIEGTRARLPQSVEARQALLRAWGAPEDTHAYLLRRNLCPLAEELVASGMEPIAATTLLGHDVRHAMGDREIDPARVRWAVDAARERALTSDVLPVLAPLALREPASSFDELLTRAEYRRAAEKDVKAEIRREVKRSDVRRPEARHRAIMGHVRAMAWGNVPLAQVAAWVEEATR